MVVVGLSLVGCAEKKDADSMAPNATGALPPSPGTLAPTPTAADESSLSPHSGDGSAAPTSGAPAFDAPKALEAEKAELQKKLAEQESKEGHVEEKPKNGLEKGVPDAHRRCAPDDPLCLPDDQAHDQSRHTKNAPMLATAKSLTDRLTSEQIDQVVADNIDKFVPCAKADSFLTLHASITPEGKVLDASSDASIPDEPRLRDCVLKALGAVTFPKAAGTRPSPVTFDLMLKPRAM